MARRRNRSPLASLALFLIVCGMGWAAWEHRDDLKGQREDPILEIDMRDRLEDSILDDYEHDACFFDLRGGLGWRPNEHRFRLDILLELGSKCEERAKEICRKIAQYITAETDRPATVVAYDTAGRELGRYVL